MKTEDLLSEIMKLSPELSSNYCVINGTLIELGKVEKMGCSEFGLQSKLHMPLKLYRYYSNIEKDNNGQAVNHSQDALKTNTVFMNSPVEFDDAYDSEISIEYSEFERFRLIEYCRRCHIKANSNSSNQEIGNTFVQFLWKYYCEHKKLDGVFAEPPKSEIERLSNEEFCLRTIVEYCKNKDFGKAVSNVIQKEYGEQCDKLKNTFRIACFATTPYLQLMWASYADSHKGFCVEYTVQPNTKEYEKIYYNLFPVIYCKMRSDITQYIAENRDQMPDEEYLWNLYFHGALRKSIDWAYQNEWRLLLPYGIKDKDYNVEFFPITKVYLGNKMSAESRKEIISICKDKGIPYAGVTRNPTKFEMQDCEILCENCPRYQNQ